MHIGIAHYVKMEHVPLDVPNGGQWCEYDDINDHDVVMSEYHGSAWLWMGVPYPMVA